MMKKLSFKNPRLDPEANSDDKAPHKLVDKITPNIPNKLCLLCPKCKNIILREELERNYYICNTCEHHFRMLARDRIHMILDDNSFSEIYYEQRVFNPLDFPDYEDKIEKAKSESREEEAVICGIGTIKESMVAVFAMEALFMMGSMGTVVGEKITSLFEYATKRHIPVIGFTLSGGARMQEGILSLMQMAKISAAVKNHSLEGGLYITVLNDPTTGGVTASFAMQGDVIIAEPNALIGFAGPRVIEQTINRSLPKGFQTSEFLLDKGFIDDIVHRKDLRNYLWNLLLLSGYGGINGSL